MIATLRTLLCAQNFDPLDLQRATILRAILVVMSVIHFCATLVVMFFRHLSWFEWAAIAIMQASYLIGIKLVDRGYGKMVGLGVSTLLSLCLVVLVYFFPDQPIYLHFLVLPLLFVGFVLRSVYIWVLCLFQFCGLGVVIAASYFAGDTQQTAFYYILTMVIMFVVAVAMWLNSRLSSRYVVDLLSAKETATTLQVEAEEASRTKSKFLANMSHELRTPLTAIMGYTELIMEDLSETSSTDPVVLDDLAKIRQSSDHLLTLISGVLDLAKVESGQMNIYIETFDVSRILDEVVAVTNPLVKDKEIDISVQLAEHLPQMVTDRTKVRQILLNLLSNAAKFTHKGKIVLSSRAAMMDGSNGIEFSVKDTGIGMTQEASSRVFGAFEQADSSTTREFGGTGLGLALCDVFVSMLGGTIAVESEPRLGSTFTVWLPLSASNVS